MEGKTRRERIEGTKRGKERKKGAREKGMKEM